jgi:hypothetical protein
MKEANFWWKLRFREARYFRGEQLQKHSGFDFKRIRTSNQRSTQMQSYMLDYFFIFFYNSHGVRLGPLGTAATVWPIIPAPDNRWWWLWSNRWNVNCQGKPKYSEKTCPIATLCTTNPTWPDPGSSPGRRGAKPATNCLIYSTANLLDYLAY